MKIARQETGRRHSDEVQRALEENEVRWRSKVGPELAWTLGRTHQLRRRGESRDEMWPYETTEDRSAGLGQALTQLSSM